MKTKMLMAIALMLISSVLVGTSKAARQDDGVTLNWEDFSTDVQRQMNDGPAPLLIEFFDSKNSSASCVREEKVFASIQKHYAGQLRLVRVDVQKQPKNMALAGVTVCPTHLVLLAIGGEIMVFQKSEGYLTEDQLKHLIKETWGI